MRHSDQIKISEVLKRAAEEIAEIENGTAHRTVAERLWDALTTNSSVYIRFIKADGTQRSMIATRMESRFDNTEMPPEDKAWAVMDTQLGEVRSFIPHRVSESYVITEKVV